MESQHKTMAKPKMLKGSIKRVFLLENAELVGCFKHFLLFSPLKLGKWSKLTIPSLKLTAKAPENRPPGISEIPNLETHHFLGANC